MRTTASAADPTARLVLRRSQAPRGAGKGMNHCVFTAASERIMPDRLLNDLSSDSPGCSLHTQMCDRGEPRCEARGVNFSAPFPLAVLVG